MKITGNPKEVITYLALTGAGYFLTGQNANMGGVILLAVASFLLGNSACMMALKEKQRKKEFEEPQCQKK